VRVDPQAGRGDEPIPDLRAGAEDEVETGAGLVETDGAVAGAVAGIWTILRFLKP
jgi:hypothetical protein